MFGWLYRRNESLQQISWSSIRQTKSLQYCRYTKVKSSSDENCSTKKYLLVKPIFTYGTLDPFAVIIHGIVRFQAKSTYIFILSILDVFTFQAIPLSVISLWVSAHVVKGHQPLGGSLTYQVLKMNTVHPQARREFELSEGRVNRLGRSDQHIGRILLDCQSQLGQKGLCRKRCF